MSLLLLPPPPAPSFDACLDHLDDGAGYDPDLRQTPADFGSFRMIGLAPRKGWPVALCEGVVGGGFPTYAERRSWRDRLTEPFRSGILIHTDASHSSFVWSWRTTGPHGSSEYREHRIPGREPTLHRGLRDLPPFDEPPVGDPPHPLVLERLRDFIAPATVRRESENPASAMRDWIESISSPQEVRGRWRSLRRFGVLDRDCRTGDRLVQGARALEVVYLPLLERMRSFVDDAGGVRNPRQREHLRDLRQIVDGVEKASSGFVRLRFIRRLIVQQNLFAIASGAGAARRCARDLLDYAGLADDGVPVIDCNVWHRRVNGHRSLQQRESDGDGLSHHRREIELFQRAWRELRRMRLEGGDQEEFVRAGNQLEVRRRLLRRQLIELQDSADGTRTDDEDYAFCRSPDGGSRFRAVLGSSSL